MKIFFYGWVLIYLSACSSQYGRYQQKHDSTPTRAPFPSELKDATPKYEAYKKANSRPYTVRGKNYTVLKSGKGFTQTGTASWYGNKFHGHLTANGEIYNMYSMSAAHKNLPLPTYLKVTNLDNNKSIVVRVNDRGPFHEDRIIDLSYSAAYKLDMLKTGTAHVKISAITDFSSPKKQAEKYKAATAQMPTPILNPVSKVPPSLSLKTPKAPLAARTNEHLPHTFIQVFSTGNKLLAQKTAEALSILHQQKSKVVPYGSLYRVMSGPFKSEEELNHLLNRLKETGYPTAFKKLILTP